MRTVVSDGTTEDELTLVLVGSTALYREGLAHLLEEQDHVRVLATAGSVEEAMAALGHCDPSVVVLDVALEQALALVAGVSTMRPDTPVVAFGTFEHEQEMLGWARAGVSGYVDQQASVADLLAAMQAARRGELVCSPRFAGLLLRDVRGAGVLVQTADRPPLTPREYEVLALLAEGLPNKTIAQRLQIELPTVKNHVHHLLEKLGATSRAEAGAKARLLGMTLHPRARRASNAASPERTLGAA